MYTHEQLVERSKTWLKNTANCGVVITEMFATTSTGETPDAIGFRQGGVSILIECKSSRQDFLADKKKYFRNKPELGMGLYRFYLCPNDVIRPDEIPDKWGLMYMGPRKSVKRIKGGPDGNMWLGDPNDSFKERNKQAEWDLLYSALRRKK